LHAGGLLYFTGVGFELRARLGIEDVREITDIALRLERFKIER